MQLDALLDILEQDIAGSLSVEDLAGAGFVSRTQLYREFYNATGHSVKEYVRKRRLSRALTLIKHTDLPLLQVAQDCGFGSQQALCKAVKALTGHSPLQYKSGGGEYFFPPGDGETAHTVTVSTETIPPTRRLCYYDSRLRGIENRALAWLFAEMPSYTGRIFGRNGQQRGAKLCYELYIESDQPDQPAITGAFAKTLCANTETEINAAWDYLYDRWLKTSMFSQSELPYFEEYIHAGGQVKRLALYLPVERRPGFHKIKLCSCEDMHFLIARRSGRDAEEAASRAVMGFLAAHYPALAQSARQFYVSTVQGQAAGLRLVGDKAYACGIALVSPMQLPPGDVEIITRPAGEYAVLEGDCCGDSGAYQSVLGAWMEGMGLQADGAPFAVYEAERGFDTQNIRVKLYCRAKNGTNGQDRPEKTA